MEKYFFFDRIRSVVGDDQKIAIQGYAVDDYMDLKHPRAAVFDGGKPVKELACYFNVVKLPALRMRQKGERTISDLVVIYIDLSEVKEKFLSKGATLVLIAETNTSSGGENVQQKISRIAAKDTREGDKRVMLYKCSLTKALKALSTYSFVIDTAYVENGITHVGGWTASGENASVTVEDVVSGETLFHKDKQSGDSLDDGVSDDGVSDDGVSGISFIPRDDILLEYPECASEGLRPEGENSNVWRDNLHADVDGTESKLKTSQEMGYDIALSGEFRKLRITMSDGVRSSSKDVNVRSADFWNSKLDKVVRASGKVARNLKEYGIKDNIEKIKLHTYPTYFSINRHYDKWFARVSPDKADLGRQRMEQESLAYRPLFSILVPLYETDEVFLKELIDSLKAQTYPNWEACFSDGSKDSSRLSEIVGRYSKADDRIRYVAELPGPLGISSNTNQAFSIAKGEFIVLGDHDDLLTPDALYECARVLNEKNISTLNDINFESNGDAEQTSGIIDIIYTDEDKVNSTAKKRFEPNLKPKFNQELLESGNYITHMFVVRKSLVDEVGLFDDTYNGAQDFDFILRCTEKARGIYHIPKVLYSWRINDTSTAGDPTAKMYAYDAGVKALQAHYDRTGVEATAEKGEHLGYYQTQYPVPEDAKLYVVVVNSDSKAINEFKNDEKGESSRGIKDDKKTESSSGIKDDMKDDSSSGIKDDKNDESSSGFKSDSLWRIEDINKYMKGLRDRLGEKDKATLQSIKSILDTSGNDKHRSFHNVEFLLVNSRKGLNLSQQVNYGITRLENLDASENHSISKESDHIDFNKNNNFDKVSETSSKSTNESAYICFIESGVTLARPDSLTDMLSYLANNPDAGAVGGKIYMPDGTMNHAGVILTQEKIEGWMYLRHSIYDEMYFNYSAYSALRRGVVMFRLEDLERFGDFDPEFDGETAFIDYTYRMSKEGYKSIYDAKATFSYEFARGRNAEDAFESMVSKQKDLRLLIKKYPEMSEGGDIYYKSV